MNDLLKGEISDLRLFADPFEAFTGVPDVDGWKADFVRKGEDIAIQRKADGTIRTLAGPGRRKYRSFKGLLVSEVFANLERLASAQRHRTARLVDPDTGSLKEFLPVVGEILWDDGTSEPLRGDPVECRGACVRIVSPADRVPWGGAAMIHESRRRPGRAQDHFTLAGPWPAGRIVLRRSCAAVPQGESGAGCRCRRASIPEARTSTRHRMACRTMSRCGTHPRRGRGFR